jgi:4-amino-4-deoxy-L-arabinose transferase-like glycosyltransferase
MRSGTWLGLLAKPAVILLAALVLRLGVLVFLPLTDEGLYLFEPGQTAANLVAGRGYTFDFYGLRAENPLQAFLPPLCPWLIALALQFKEPALTFGLFQVLLGTMTVGLLYRLATEMAGRRVGSLAGWGAAIYPPYVLLVNQAHSTLVHAFLLIAVLLACWRVYKRPTIGRSLLAGGLVGLFALGRPQMVALVPLIAGWLWLNRVRGRPLGRSTAGLVLGAMVVVLPWAVRNSVLFGQPAFLSTNGGITFWNGNNPFTTGSAHDVYADEVAAYLGIERDPSLPDVYQYPDPYPSPPEIEAGMGTMSELELDRAYYRAGLDYIRTHPADWLKLEGQKLVSFWWFRPNLGANPIYRDHWKLLYQIQYPLLLLLAIAGVALSARRSEGGSRQSWRRYALLYAVPAFYTAVHVAFNVLTRYRWEIESLLLLFAALALGTAWQKIEGRRKVL